MKTELADTALRLRFVDWRSLPAARDGSTITAFINSEPANLQQLEDLHRFWQQAIIDERKAYKTDVLVPLRICG